MRKQAVSNAADSPMQWLEQIARLAQSARNSALLLERVLQLLGDVLEAIAGAVVLVGEAGKRPQEWCWGTYQQHIVQVGRELVQGLEAHSAATARHTRLPGTTRETAHESGVYLTAVLVRVLTFRMETSWQAYLLLSASCRVTFDRGWSPRLP